MKFKAGNHALSCVGATPGCQSVLVGSSSLALWSVSTAEAPGKVHGTHGGHYIFLRRFQKNELACCQQLQEHSKTQATAFL